MLNDKLNQLRFIINETKVIITREMTLVFLVLHHKI